MGGGIPIQLAVAWAGRPEWGVYSVEEGEKGRLTWVKCAPWCAKGDVFIQQNLFD